MREGLDLLGEQLGTDPGRLEIGTTIDVRVTTSGRRGDSAELVVESLGWLEEAGAPFCALSPMTPEALAWVAEEVAPKVS